MKDSGGPFCKLDGTLRTNSKIKFEDDFCDGCFSLEELKKYFLNKQEYIQNCEIKIYEVPEEECVIRKKCISFPKKYLIEQKCKTQKTGDYHKR